MDGAAWLQNITGTVSATRWYRCPQAMIRTSTVKLIEQAYRVQASGVVRLIELYQNPSAGLLEGVEFIAQEVKALEAHLSEVARKKADALKR